MQILQLYQVYKREVKMAHVLSCCSVIIQRGLLGWETYPKFLKYKGHSANFVRCKTTLRHNELPCLLFKWASRLFLLLSNLSICSFGCLFLTHSDTGSIIIRILLPHSTISTICRHSLCGHSRSILKAPVQRPMQTSKSCEVNEGVPKRTCYIYSCLHSKS